MELNVEAKRIGLWKSTGTILAPRLSIILRARTPFHRCMERSCCRLRLQVGNRSYAEGELLEIGELILAKQNHKLSASGREALGRYIAARKLLPHFLNTRSIRNALDRVRLRQANRIARSAGGAKITADDLMTIEAPDLLASREFGQQAAAGSPLSDESEESFD